MVAQKLECLFKSFIDPDLFLKNSTAAAKIEEIFDNPFATANFILNNAQVIREIFKRRYLEELDLSNVTIALPHPEIAASGLLISYAILQVSDTVFSFVAKDSSNFALADVFTKRDHVRHLP
jgi:hypothetical protein